MRPYTALAYAVIICRLTNWNVYAAHGEVEQVGCHGFPTAAAKSLQSCPTLRNPIDGSPPRLPRPCDSPGKNTGVGCHFLLQCMTVKSESEVARLCLTLRDPMDCSPPGSSALGIFQARGLEWGAIAFSGFSYRGSQSHSQANITKRALLQLPHAPFFLWASDKIQEEAAKHPFCLWLPGDLYAHASPLSAFSRLIRILAEGLFARACVEAPSSLCRLDR